MEGLDFAQEFLADETHLLLSVVDSACATEKFSSCCHSVGGHDHSKAMYNLRPRSNSPNGEEVMPLKQEGELTSAAVSRNRRSRVSLKKRLLVNARERERMKILNKGFQALRDALPCYIADGHMAKITTLRLAINYIKALSEVLDEDPPFPVHGMQSNSSKKTDDIPSKTEQKEVSRSEHSQTAD